MANDSWSTPPEIFAALNAEFNFCLDVCATHGNTKVKSAYLTDEINALNAAWVNYRCPLTPSYWAWCNPPYSSIGPWVEKAVNEMENGLGTVMLVMSDHSTGWFDSALTFATECRLITNGRLSFINPETGKPQPGNNKGSAIFVFNPHTDTTCTITTVRRNFLMRTGRNIIDTGSNPSIYDLAA